MSKHDFKFDKTRIQLLRQMEKESGEKIVAILANIFFESTPISLRNIDLAFAEGKTEVIAMEAHKLKSGCGNLGFTSLSDTFERIERSIKQGDLSQLSSDIESARSQMKQAVITLRDLATDDQQKGDI